LPRKSAVPPRGVGEKEGLAEEYWEGNNTKGDGEETRGDHGVRSEK